MKTNRISINIRRTVAPFAVLAIAALLGACAGHHPRPDDSTAQACQPITEAGIDRLFTEWNAALQTGKPDTVVDLYAERSILLSTLSRTPRITRAQKIDYFKHFLEKNPVGTIDTSMKFIGCNSAVNAGTYTFRFPPTDQVVPARYTYTYAWDAAKKQWLITSHHSSVEPTGE